MIDEKLLGILCCPESRQSLRRADTDTVTSLNARIPTGGLVAKSGEVVGEPFDDGLVREDDRVLYPVRNGAPVLLVSAGIDIGDEKSAETAKRETEEEAGDGD